MKDGKRDYKTEYDKYHSEDKQKKNRAKRNKARAQLEAEGRVSKGDGKDVDHITPLSKGGSTGKGNLRVKSKASNRSFPRNKDSSIK
jgi:hypothetical protein